MEKKKNKKMWRTVEDNWLKLQEQPKKRMLITMSKILIGPLLLLGFIVLLGFIWLKKNFSGANLDMMVMQMMMPLEGTGGDYVTSFMIQVLLPGIVCTVVFLVIGHSIRKKGMALFIGNHAVFPNRILSFALVMVFTFSACTRAIVSLEVPEYLANRNAASDFIEENYVDPRSKSLVFPEKKRNLIYIYMESMETTLFSKDHGGQMEQEVMPELYKIASNNINFSDKGKVGGSVPLTGMGITSSAIVAQTAGLPLLVSENWKGEEANEVFVPKAVTLGDVLFDNGYKQYFVVGSEAEFGAKDKYFTDHGNATIFDLRTARQEGIVPENYHNKFWGMEDMYLYEFAKKKLLEVAEDDTPFSYNILTVDTHFPDGYVCDLCKDEFGEQYTNVFACASRQLGSFMKWLEQQDFYDNTTVVITGDHLTMNVDYFTRNNLDVTQRRVYNAFINTPDVIPAKSKDRMFASIDMFPTTLAALGVEIEDDRLGLGTNLFSDQSTLLEMYGYDLVETEFKKQSEYYKKTFEN